MGTTQEDCLEFFSQGNFDQAFTTCSSLDEKTAHHEVLAHLGYMYLFGKGAPQDLRRGIELLNQSGIRGNARSSYILSQLYAEGKLIAKNSYLAEYYRHDAISKGYAPAVVAEVQSHYLKDPADKSPMAVRELQILKDIASSEPQAAYLLARCYHTGYGTSQDLNRAEELYRSLTDPRKSLDLGLLYEARGDREQAEVKYREALQNCASCAPEANYRLGMLLDQESFLQKAVALGYYQAEVEMGRRIISRGHKGSFRIEDWLRAESYFNDGCQHNISESCVLAGRVYFRHLIPSPERTAYYVSRLISSGTSQAFELLGQEYLRGTVLHRDENMAFEMYRRSRELGDLQDVDVLAKMYLDRNDKELFREICEEGVRRNNQNCSALLAYENFISGLDPRENIMILTALSSQGNSLASCRLFRLYQSSSSGITDHEKAFDYLVLASKQGSPEAIRKYFSYLLEQDRYEEANWYLSRARELDFPFTPYLQGLLYLKSQPSSLKKALESFKQAAERGFPEALIQMGNIYENPRFGEADQFLACSLYFKAQQLGVKEAPVRLAWCLTALHDSDGRNLLPYMEKAASMGDGKMITYLVNLYSDDLNGIRNDRELVRWITLGARQGITDCLYRLGELYLSGFRNILDKNEVLARKYLNLAIDQGSSSAAWVLSNYYEKKSLHSSFCNILERFVDNTDYAFASGYALCYLNGVGRHRDVKKGEEILKTAYEKNPSPDIAYLLGQIYSDEGSEIYSLENAVDWFMDAVDLGDTNALYDLGRIYEIKSPLFSLEKAFHYYQKAAETGNMAAELKLAEAYYYGRGIKQDHSKGCDLAQEAASYSIGEAYPLLASCYLYGQGRSKSFDKAVAVLHDGDNNSNSDSSFMLAELYSSGTFVDPDPEFACRYYYRSVLFSETLDQVQRGASFFFPGKMCHAGDDRTFVALSIYQKRFNTSHYQRELLKIQTSLKHSELSAARVLLEKFMETDGHD